MCGIIHIHYSYKSFVKAYNYLGKSALIFYEKRKFLGQTFIESETSDGDFYGGNLPFRDYMIRQIHIKIRSVMLKLINITKEYKVDEESVLALHDVSIEFRKNEFVSILGPSGCGKTTLLNIIGGLDRYTDGDIQIDSVSTKEYDDVDWDTYRNRRIGFVFQSYNLIPHMNILKNVAMSLTLAGVESEERKARALEALRKVGLESQAKKKPNQLSGGQMQRVAIARALVNNPEIILADEPTGALDSESGIQVMDLLKEVAQDRLVVMVTHNPTLAEEYSTRIVYLKDGEVVGDTMPYSSADEEKEILDEKVDTNVIERIVEVEKSEGDVEVKEVKVEETKPKKKTLRERFLKWKKADRAGMKLGTAINLSWNNLLAKKGRTLLTSIAGSIGIIGIVLVLSLSNGASAYVRGLEESALSTYPISVNKSSMNVMSLMQDLMGFNGSSSSGGEVNDNEFWGELVLGNFIPSLTKNKPNDLHGLKKKIDADFDKNLATVKYNYGTTFNVYVTDPKSDVNYMKTMPYAENMYGLFNKFVEAAKTIPGLNKIDIKNMTFDVMGQKMTITAAMAYLSKMIGEPWAEISENTTLVNSQYEVVGGKWPTKANEVVIVVSEDNMILDYQLFMLGLKSSEDLTSLLASSALGNAQAFVAQPYSLDHLLGLEYKIMSNVDYLVNQKDSDTWIMGDRSSLDKKYVDAHAIKFADGTDTVKVVGVVRPKKGAIASSIGGVIGYTKALTETLLTHSENHEAVKEMKARYDEAVSYLEGKDTKTSYTSAIEIYDYKFTNDGYTTHNLVHVGDEVTVDLSNPDTNQHARLMRELGFIDKEYPQRIDFYCSSFESKQAVEDFLKANDINYSDSLSSMMQFVNTMVNTITGVLVGFAAISLIVSTIMIAIIIYTSVLERRKEIGVLRSIGARKRDISRVFIAESAILGGYSGLIGIIISAIVCVIGNVIIEWKLGIEDLVSVSWWQCLAMFFVSILLSVLAGFIPSRIAAKKDPAIALRSE